MLEDIHWADDGLLDFVTHLVEWAQESSLLVLCTARPELLERRPGWEATTIRLSPLSDEETGQLLSSLVRVDLPRSFLTERQATLCTSSSPRGYSPRAAPSSELPTTVQGIIAARIDGMPTDEKALLQRHRCDRRGLLERRGSQARRIRPVGS